MTINPSLRVVWFKRDLRLQDNEAIYNALASGERVLLLYVFEEILINDPHYSQRHWDFIKQSIVDLNEQLKTYNSKILAVSSNIIPVINQLLSFYHIKHIYSHQETGILVTYDRDKTFQRFCKNNFITWHENVNNGVIRGLKDRENWVALCNTFFENEPLVFQPKSNQLLSVNEINSLENLFKIPSLQTNLKTPFQKGGRVMGTKYLNSFLSKRYSQYTYNISKPELSRTSCSRLSPYLAWGNLSVREVCKKVNQAKQVSPNKKQLESFMSRLRWQSHFIQKFEMEHTMEAASINKGYRQLKKDRSKVYKEAWENGQTGYPLVDACMRCLKETGYLNFRMRALVVSFFTHNLWQPWQEATTYLSRMFLDFEPGIHFPQLQMQAGETGINILRIYNPVKNSLEFDPDAIFIKKWVPELKELPIPLAHEPYLITPLEQQMYNFKLGVQYPFPIVDADNSRKKASQVLWNMRNDSLVKSESKRILSKHTIKIKTSKS